MAGPFGPAGQDAVSLVELVFKIEPEHVPIQYLLVEGQIVWDPILNLKLVPMGCVQVSTHNVCKVSEFFSKFC